jgi:hypothetical protein
VDEHAFTKNRITLNRRYVPNRKIITTVSGMESSANGGIHITSTTRKQEMYCETLRMKRSAAIRKKRRRMLTYGVELLHDNVRPHRAARTTALLKHFNWKLFDYLLTVLTSLRATTACSPSRRSYWDHSDSTIMRSWRKVSKRSRAHR